MSWQTGLTDSYLTALQALIDCATNSYVDSAVVVAGGTGYAVGDILTINGGTVVGGHTPAVEVLTLSGSAVATVRLARGGAMTANPGTAATTTAETGGGSGATITTTIAAQLWTVLRRSQQVVTAAPTIVSGGTGYAVGDVVTLALGQGKQPFDWALLGTTATWTVASISGGGGTGPITSFDPINFQGNYEVTPGTTALPTETAQSGTGLTLTVAYEDVTDKDYHVVLQGEGGSGFVDPIVAIQTYYTIDQFNNSDPVRNWLTLGLVTYNSQLALREQVLISPGFDESPLDGSLLTDRCPNVPLKDLVTTSGSHQIEFWFSIRDRRLMGEFKAHKGGAALYPSFYLGHYNQAGTRLEFPYPLYVGASTQRMNTAFSDSSTSICSGILENCGYRNSTSQGDAGDCSAYFYHTGLSRWIGLRSIQVNSLGVMISAVDVDTQLHGIYPIMNPYASGDSGARDVFGSPAGLHIHDFIDGSDPTTPTADLHPTPDGAGETYLLIPATIVGKTDDFTDGIDPLVWDIFGELDGLFWVSGVGGVSSEDTFLIGTDRYRVFQNGNRTAYNSSYMVFKED